MKSLACIVFAGFASAALADVAIDGQGRILRDGKPFFPVGMYTCRMSDGDMALWRSSPFNFAIQYGAATREDLDKWEKAGTCIATDVRGLIPGYDYAVRNVCKTEEESRRMLQRRVDDLAGHPALLAWYLVDEAPTNFFPVVKAARRFLREADPVHPAIAVTDKWGHFSRLKDLCDVLGTDPYPIGNRGERADIGIASGWTQKARQSKNCVLGVPQSFNWAWYKKGEETNNPAYRMPTRQEMANMAWQMVAAGANGICMYAFHPLRSHLEGRAFDAAWGDVCAVGRELRQMEEIVLADPSPLAFADVPDALVCRLWRKDGEDWLLVANRTTRPVKARLSAPERIEAVDTRLGGGVTAGDGRLDVALPPHGYSFVRLKFRFAVKMLPGENWWGCANYFGADMPFDEHTRLEIDLRKSGWSNQYASFLVSDKGREIWCDEQCRFEFRDGVITVEPEGCASVEFRETGGGLRDAFRYASARHFPPSGRMPHRAFFEAPQYNTWIELTYHQNEKDILAYAQSMLDNGLPPGVLMIDDTWQTGYGEWYFDGRHFRDPKGMVEKLHAMGFKVILWICPWVGMDTPAYRRLAHGRDPDTVVRQPVGGLYMDASGKRPAACQWWNGVSALLDFTHPQGRAWFKATLDRLVSDYGVDGFKLDGGALQHYKNGFCPHKYMPSGDQANGFAAFALQYPVCEYRHAWKLGGQPIVERLHDKKHSWEDLRTLIPAMIAGGLLGHPFMCPDMIGGGEWKCFLPGAPFDPELFVRSAQVHALCGQMQFSASPWRILKDPRHREIVRAMVALRQHFAGRFVELAAECGRTGEPMIRNLEYAFPNRGYAKVLDQFMMGDFLMVAPVLEKGATSRKVVIPPGRWMADDGTAVTGPAEIEVDAPLSRLPHYCPSPNP